MAIDRRRGGLPPAIVTLSIALALTGCAGALTSPPGADEVDIVVSTTGGIAGMDWQVTLDGSSGTIFLSECRRNCPVIVERSVADATVEEIAAAFVEAGVREQPVLDFGVCAQCADQFHHVIEYSDRSGSYRVQGDGPNFPADLAEAVGRILWEPAPPTE